MSRAQKKNLLLLDTFNFLYKSFILFLATWIPGSFLLSSSWPVENYFCLALAIILFLFLFCLIPALIYFFLPKLREGKHSFPSSKDSFIWTFKFYIKKPITLPFIREFVGTFHFFKVTLLKLQRSKCSFSSQIAANVELRDPEFIHIGKGVTIGSDTILAPHRMLKSELELYNIVIEDDVSIGAFCKIGPGVRIKKGAKIGTNVQIKPFSTIGENSILGDFVIVLDKAQIGDKVIVRDTCIIKKNQQIPNKSIIKDES